MFRSRPILMLLALLGLAACSPTTSLAPSAQPTPGGSASVTPGPTDATSPAATPGASSAATTTVRAYFVLGSHTGDGGLVPVLREVPQTVAVGAAAMSALFAGPNPQELGADPAMYTSITTGMRSLGLSIDAGVATANVSADFAVGSDLDVRGRFAQVVYTLTQFPTITGVRFLLDGVPPKTAFIGTFTRADYTDLLPAIWVDQPAWGGDLTSPARITGLANVFEGQFHVEILDATGHSLGDQPVHASCGTGCWGTFDVTIPVTIATAQAGTLRVYDTSEQGGARQHVVDYPVTLTP